MLAHLRPVEAEAPVALRERHVCSDWTLTWGSERAWPAHRFALARASGYFQGHTNPSFARRSTDLRQLLAEEHLPYVDSFLDLLYDGPESVKGLPDESLPPLIVVADLLCCQALHARLLEEADGRLQGRQLPAPGQPRTALLEGLLSARPSEAPALLRAARLELLADLAPRLDAALLPQLLKELGRRGDSAGGPEVFISNATTCTPGQTLLSKVFTVGGKELQLKVLPGGTRNCPGCIMAAVVSKSGDVGPFTYELSLVSWLTGEAIFEAKGKASRAPTSRETLAYHSALSVKNGALRESDGAARVRWRISAH